MQKTAHPLTYTVQWLYTVARRWVVTYILVNIFYHHFVKSARIRSFSDSYFLAFALNTDQKNSEYMHLPRSTYLGPC